MRFIRSQLIVSIAVVGGGAIIALATGCNRQPTASPDQQA
jgi:hypothetical protein